MIIAWKGFSFVWGFGYMELIAGGYLLLAIGCGCFEHFVTDCCRLEWGFLLGVG